MPTATARPTLNLRIQPDLRQLIDRGALAQGKNRTDFILDAARRAAEEAVMGQVMVWANPQTYAAFLTALDKPAQPNERLRRTMQSSAPWDSR